MLHRYGCGKPFERQAGEKGRGKLGRESQHPGRRWWRQQLIERQVGTRGTGLGREEQPATNLICTYLPLSGAQLRSRHSRPHLLPLPGCLLDYLPCPGSSGPGWLDTTEYGFGFRRERESVVFLSRVVVQVSSPPPPPPNRLAPPPPPPPPRSISPLISNLPRSFSVFN